MNQYVIDKILLLTAACFSPRGTIIKQLYIYNMTKLNELPIWIHVLEQHVHIIKDVKFLPCVVMRITILPLSKISEVQEICI
jgi:hypothetical protein